jgi:hypothetical protein
MSLSDHYECSKMFRLAVANNSWVETSYSLTDILQRFGGA